MRENKPKNFRKNEGHDVQLSKTLSHVLRHSAISQGLNISADGFIDLDQVLQYLKKKGFRNIDLQQIQKVVNNNDKKRFQLVQNGHNYSIRATQGHTMKEVQTEKLLTKIIDPTPYPTVIHGTYLKVWPLIKKEGLKRMARNHIHFAIGMPKEEGVISGMRGSADLIIEIDMEAAMKEGIEFYISSNLVILTEGQGKNGILPAKFFKRVVRKDGTDIKEADLEKIESKNNKKAEEKEQEIKQKQEKKERNRKMNEQQQAKKRQKKQKKIEQKQEEQQNESQGQKQQICNEKQELKPE